VTAPTPAEQPVQLSIGDARLAFEFLGHADQRKAFGDCKDHLNAAGECSVCTLMERLQTAIWDAEEAVEGVGLTAKRRDMARHPVGPNVAAGARVARLITVGPQRCRPDENGTVLPPGYDLSRLTEDSEPAMRVIAVRLDDGRTIDCTSWALAGVDS
jgi:hypothetical protein